MLPDIVAYLYGFILFVLLAYSLVEFHLAMIHRRKRIRGEPVPGAATAADVPFITVQLPLYNERHVAERLIEAVSCLDYPRDRFEIHVLDDSTDDTPEIVAGALRKVAARGISVRHIRRAVRQGYKAGALRDAMAYARGAYIAIFDADFCPAPEMLRKAIPYFADPRIAIVQLRWSFLNEDYSLLTRLQAFMLGGHFAMEQPARSYGGLFGNFNGTAGLWRRAAIEDAGGWRANTLTEDLDLSYRAQLRGWRIAYLESQTCDCELPVDMDGFRSQQYRWMKGGAENARLHLRPVLASAQPLHVKLHACTHLLASSVFIFTLGLALSAMILNVTRHELFDSLQFWLGTAIAANLLAVTAVFHEAHRPVGLRGHARFAATMAAFLVFSLAICLHNAVAVIAGWIGRPSEFVRTPKFGVTGKRGDWAAMDYASRRIAPIVWAEIALFLLAGASLAVSTLRGDFTFAAVLLLLVTGLGWIIAISVLHVVMAWFRRAAPLLRQTA